MAESFQPDEIISHTAIVKTILFGLVNLSDKEKMFLLVATSLLSHKEIQKGNAFCYLGGYSLRRALGGAKGPIRPRTLSKIKKSLEEKGLIIRHYDSRNRPLEKGAIDLRPFLARLDEFQVCVEAFFQQTRDHFEGKQSLQRQGYKGDPPEDSQAEDSQAENLQEIAPGDVAMDPDSKDRVGCLQNHPNRLNPTVVFNTVQTKAESTSSRPINSLYPDQLTADQATDGPNSSFEAYASSAPSLCSPQGASVFWKGYEKSGKQRHLKAIVQLGEAVGLSDQLQAYIPLTAIKAADENAILEGCYSFISENFVAKRNTNKTFHWAVNKFGWKAVLLLVCAIEDETVISREGWMGHMTTKSNRSLDLKTNFDRIRRQQNAGKRPRKGQGGIVTSDADTNATEDSSPAASRVFAGIADVGRKEETSLDCPLVDQASPPRGRAATETLGSGPLAESPLEGLVVEPDPNHDLWLDVREYVRGEKLMSESEVRSWLDTAWVVSLRRNQMLLAVKAGFHRSHLEQNFVQVLEIAIFEILDRDIEIVVEIHPERKCH